MFEPILPSPTIPSFIVSPPMLLFPERDGSPLNDRAIEFAKAATIGVNVARAAGVVVRW
jgi:hypothetical protein